jgi:hypothetical protein
MIYKKTLGLLSKLTIVFTLVIIIHWVYDAFIKKPPLTYEGLAFDTVGKTFKPGDVVPVRVKRCNNTDAPLTYLIAHNLYSVRKKQSFIFAGAAATPTFLLPGCETITSPINRLPFDTLEIPLPDDEYQIFGSGYGTDPATGKVFSSTWYTKPFTVKK